MSQSNSSTNQSKSSRFLIAAAVQLPPRARRGSGDILGDYRFGATAHCQSKRPPNFPLFFFLVLGALFAAWDWENSNMRLVRRGLLYNFWKMYKLCIYKAY